jgi:hypothetical protein
MSLILLSPAGNEDVAKRMKWSAEKHGLKVRLMVGPMGSPHGADIQAVWPIQLMKTLTEEYVMMVDAPDVLLLAGEDEILDKFHSFGNPFVMSAENYCMTNHLDIPTLLPAMCKPTSHPYPNCGCWIGERQRAIDLLQQSIDLYRYTPAYPSYALDGPGAWFTYGRLYGTMDYALDCDSVLFQSMGGPTTNHYAEVREGRIYNRETGTWPIAIHYNGSGNDRSEYYKMANTLYGYAL